jgi:transposase-like protein
MKTSMNTVSGQESEVTATARRRSFTKEYKLRILDRADRCVGSGEVGRLLRAEGLYSSHLTAWRKQRHEGTLKALGRKRGPKPTKTAEQREVDKLRREVVRLRRKLDHAEKIIGVQKKLSEVLGIQLEEDNDAIGED